MARSVNIAFNFQTDSAMNSIKNLTEQLKELNKNAKKQVDLKINVDEKSVKQAKVAVDSVSSNVSNKTVESLEQMIILSGRLNANLGKTSKMDDTSIKMYRENLSKATKEASRLASIFSDTEFMKTLDPNQINGLKVDLKELNRIFNATKSDIQGFSEENIKSTKAVENLHRSIQNQKVALSEISTTNAQSKQGVMALSQAYDDLGSKLFNALKNVDYRELATYQREFKELGKQVENFKKQINTPTKEKSFVSAFTKESSQLDMMLEKSKRLFESGKGSPEVRNSLEQTILQGETLNRILKTTDKTIDELTFVGLKTDSIEIIEKLKLMNKEANKIKDIGLKVTPMMGKSQTLEIPKNLDLIKEIGLKSPKLGALYGVENLKFNPAFTSDILKIDTLIEKVSRDMDSIQGKNSIKQALEQSLLEMMYLKDELKLVDKSADSITLAKYNVDIETATNKTKGLHKELTAVKNIGLKSADVWGNKDMTPQNLPLNYYKDIGLKTTSSSNLMGANMPNSIKDIRTQIDDMYSTVKSKNFSKFMQKDVDVLIDRIETLQKKIRNTGDTSKIPKFREEIRDLKKELSSLEMPNINTFGTGMAESMLGSFMTMGAKSFFNSFYGNMKSMEDVVYSLKVVAGDSAPNVTQLRNELVELARQSIYTAQEVGKAMDEIMRTGQTYQASIDITNASMDLALAHNESLASSVDIMNRLFVAIGVNSNKAEEVAQTLHTTATMTASSLNSLGIASRGFAGALGLLATTTGKSGTELENYKSQLITLGASLTGILQNLGRPAESSGVTIREYLTKLVQADNSAQEMLDSNLKRNEVRINKYTNSLVKATDYQKMSMEDRSKTILLTSNKLSQITMNDAIQATNLMSQLVNDGLIDMETMIKVFNGRYGLVVSNMLKQVGGDVMKYQAQLAKYVSLEDAIKLQEKNLNNVLKNINVEMQALMNPIYNIGKGIALIPLKPIESILSWLNGTNEEGKQAEQTMNSFGESVRNTLQFITGLGIGLGATVLGIGGLTIGVAGFLNMAGGIGGITNSLKEMSRLIKIINFSKITDQITLMTVAMKAQTATTITMSSVTGVATGVIGAMGTALKSLWGVMLANPITATLVGFGLLLTYGAKLVAQGKEYDTLSKQYQMLGIKANLTRAEIDGLKDSIDRMQSIQIRGDVNAFENISDSASDIIGTINQLQTMFGREFQPFEVPKDLDKELKSFEERYKTTLSNIEKASKESFKKSFKELTDEQQLKAIDKAFGGRTGDINSFMKQFNPYLETLNKVNEAEKEHVIKTKEFLDEKTQVFNDSMSNLNKEIVSGLSRIMQNSTAKTVSAMVAEVSSYGDTSKKYISQIVDGAQKLNVKLTANSLKNSEFVAQLSNAVALKAKLNELESDYGKIIVNTAQYGEVLAQSSLLGISANVYAKYKDAKPMAQEMAKITESIKIMVAGLNNMGSGGSKNNKEQTKSLYDMADLSSKYLISLQKIQTLGASELTTLANKRKELQAIYDMERKQEVEKLQNLAKVANMTVSTDKKSLVAKRAELEETLRARNKANANAQVSSEFNTQTKAIETLMKAIDDLLVKELEYGKELESNAYDTVKRQQQMVEESKALTSFLNEQKLAEMDILNINIELAKLAGVSSAQEQELAWLKEKYNLEKSILETQLKDTRPKNYEEKISTSKVKVGDKLTESQIMDLQKYLIEKGYATDGLISAGKNNKLGNFLTESKKSLSKAFGTEDYTKLKQKDLDLVFGMKDELKPVVKLEEFTWDKEALDKEIKEYQKRLDLQSESGDVDEKDKAILEELKAKRQAINDLERLRLEYAKQTAQIDIDTVTNATNKLLAEKELNLEKQKQLTTFDRMFMSTKQLNKLEASESKSLITDKQAQNQADLDHYSAIMSMLEFEDLTDEQREAKRLSYQAEINRLTSEGAKLELEWSKALTDEQLKRYEISKKTYDSILTGIEAVAKGEMLKPSTSSFRESAIASLSKKTSLGMEMNSGDYVNVGAYSLSLINDFMQTELANKSKALDYEAKILDLRIQGAKTEEEKAELERQQLELQKQQIDLAYKQQTSFLGVSGGSGGAMSGAFGALAGKNLSKLSSGDWIGAGIGAVSGLLGGKSAKKDAERQKKMLEYQYKMTQYLEEMNKNIEANNTLLSMTVSEGSKVGVYRATQSAIQAVVNSSDATLGGSATSAWNDRQWHGGFNRGWEDNWITTMANYDVTDFGMKESDLTNQQNILTLLAKVKEEQTKYAQYATTYNQTEGVESQAHSNYLALQEFIDALNDLYSLQASMSPKIYKQYLGATLEAVEDSSGKITDYTVTWTDFIAEQFSSIYSSISSNIKASGNAITSSLFSGLNNMFIQNYSNLGKKGGTLDKITEIYSALGQTLSSNTSAMDMTAVNSSFVDLIAYVEEYKKEQESVNEVSDEFITMWISNGGALSDVVSSMSSSMSSIYNSMKTALTGGDVTRLGSDIATNLVDSIATKLMDSKMTQAFQNLTASFSQAMADSTLSNLGSLFSTMTSTQIAMEAQASKLQAVKDLFSSEVSYSSTENVQYTSGSSKQNVYNFSNYITVASDFTFADSPQSVEKLSEALVNSITTLQKSYRG